MRDALARVMSRVRLAVPWTRRAEISRAIGLVADQHQVSRPQAFALMYNHADDHERRLLAPYRTERTPDDG